MTIKQASGLPPSLSHFVFCQYSLFGEEEATIVPPNNNPSHVSPAIKRLRPGDSAHPAPNTLRFNHVQDFVVPMTEEFLEHCQDGALSVEVYGHRTVGARGEGGEAAGTQWNVEEQQAKARSLADR